MNVRIEDLIASEFPGIDAAKFNEWKALKIKKNREQRILFIWAGILLILSVVSIRIAKLVFTSIFLILFIIGDLIFVFYRRRYRHLRHLGEELKMSARLRAKKRGEVFVG